MNIFKIHSKKDGIKKFFIIAFLPTMFGLSNMLLYGEKFMSGTASLIVMVSCGALFWLILLNSKEYILEEEKIGGDKWRHVKFISIICVLTSLLFVGMLLIFGR
ncbi:MAG: hypothetical protein GY705_06915 [Bacteroidetes bacterium]|nr:hypothetical protein [Bacteroidota bacterium]